MRGQPNYAFLCPLSGKGLNFAATFISVSFFRSRSNKTILSTIPGTPEYSQRDTTSYQKDFEECFCLCFVILLKMCDEVFDEMEDEFW